MILGLGAQRSVAAERSAADVTDHSKGMFAVPKAAYQQQFSNLYFTRLAYLGQEVKKTVKGRWGELAKNPIKTLDVEPASQSTFRLQGQSEAEGQGQ